MHVLKSDKQTLSTCRVLFIFLYFSIVTNHFPCKMFLFNNRALRICDAATAEKCRILLSASCVSFRELVADYVVRAGQDFSASETKNLATVDKKNICLLQIKSLKKWCNPHHFVLIQSLTAYVSDKMKTS